MFKRIRHSLQSCRLCCFFLRLLQDIVHADEVLLDDQGLLFVRVSGTFSGFFTSIFSTKDRMISAVISVISVYRRTIPKKESTFRRCSRTSAIAASSSKFLLPIAFARFRRWQTFGKNVIGYFSVDVALVELLHDTIQRFDAFFRLNKLFVAVAHQAIELLFILLRDQFYKFQFIGSCISRSAF